MRHPSNFTDLTGRKFGRLTVLGYDRTFSESKCPGPTKKFRAYYQCVCDCGVARHVRTDRLKDGTAASCGCLQKEKAHQSGKANKLPNGVGPFQDVLRNYKLRAKNRKVSFELSNEQFSELINGNCYYCGKAPSNIKKNSKVPDDQILYNGLDRIDSLKGYTQSNVKTCCAQCNYAKLDFSLDEFLNWIKNVHSHLQKQCLI